MEEFSACEVVCSDRGAAIAVCAACWRISVVLPKARRCNDDAAAVLEYLAPRHYFATQLRGNVKLGDQIVLTNTGKKPVTVQERAQDEAGRPIVRDKDSHLNAWTAQALVRSADRETAEPKRRGPILMVYDRSGVREQQQRPL